MRKRKAVILIACFYVLVVLLGISGLAFFRAVSENRISQRSADAMEAFYAAEAGMAYAYNEASQYGFEWYTHEDIDTEVTTSKSLADSVSVFYPVPVNTAGAQIDVGTKCYTVPGENWQVKAYPEKIGADYTGITVLLAQGTVNNTTKIRI